MQCIGTTSPAWQEQKAGPGISLHGRKGRKGVCEYSMNVVNAVVDNIMTECTAHPSKYSAERKKNRDGHTHTRIYSAP
jgi:hypothetical protein